MRVWKFLIFGVLLLAISCSNKEDAGESSRPGAVPPASSAQAKSKAAPSAIPPGGAVVLLPAAPRADTQLMAVYQGSPGPLAFSWFRNGEVLQGEESDRLPIGLFRKGDSITVVAERDGREHTASVEIGNLPPEIRQVVLKNPQIHRAVDIELEVIAEDADGDEVDLAYVWFRNDEQLTFYDGNLLPGDQFSRGDRIRFLVTPGDGTTSGAPYEAAEIVIPNAPPLFVTTPPESFQGNLYNYQARAEDADGDDLTFSLESAPAGMIIDPGTGTIEWDLAGALPGEHRITVVADDAAGQKAYQEYTLTLQQP